MATMSPDGQYWWNGTAWVSIHQQPPPGATTPPTLNMQQGAGGAWSAQTQPPQPVAQNQSLVPAAAFYKPTAEETQQYVTQAQQEAARAAQQKAGQSSNLFFRPLGPNGETTWGGAKGASVPIGYEAKYKIRMLPSVRPGLPYLKEVTHFWKSQAHPQGTAITCVGEGCEICESRSLLFKTGDNRLVERGKATAKKGTKYLVQILLIDYPQAHMQQDGSMRPLLYRMNGEVFDDFMKEAGAVDASSGANSGLFRLVDLEVGFNLYLCRKKEGSGDMEMKTSLSRLDSGPIPAVFAPALQKPYDLHDFLTPPSAAEVYTAIQEMQLPLTHELQVRLNQRAQHEAQEAAQKAAQLGIVDPSQGVPAPGQQPGYGAPQPGYGAPQQGFSSPPPAGWVPPPGFGAPAPGPASGQPAWTPGPTPGFGGPPPPAPGYAPPPGAPAFGQPGFSPNPGAPWPPPPAPGGWQPGPPAPAAPPGYPPGFVPPGGWPPR